MQFLTGIVAALVGLAMIWRAVDEPLLPFPRWNSRPQHVMRYALGGETLFIVGLLMMIKGWPK